MRKVFMAVVLLVVAFFVYMLLDPTNGSSRWTAILFLYLIALGFIAFNYRGIRARLPLLKSGNKMVALAGWLVLGVVAIYFLSAVGSTLPATSKVASVAATSEVAAPKQVTASTAASQPTTVPTARPTAVPTEAPTAMPTAVPTAVPTASPTATALPPTATPIPPTPVATLSPIQAAQEAVKAAAQKQFGSNLKDAQVSKVDTSVVVRVDARMPTPDTASTKSGDRIVVSAAVDYDLGAQWDANTAVSAAANDLKDLGPKVFANPGIDVLELRSFTQFKDQYGNTTSEVAIKFTMSRATAAKINWQGVNPKNFQTILDADFMAGDDDDQVYVHPALQSAWRAYTSSR